VDFTLARYGELCRAMLDSDLRIVTVREYVEQSSERAEAAIVLRHDVDRFPQRALRMAALEHSLRIRSTYYFRKRRGTFKPRLMRQIESMGHEIGYHYEVLAKTKGDVAGALRLFDQELKDFRRVCHTVTACMHGSPLSRYDNRDIWEKTTPERYGLTGVAGLVFNRPDVVYLSDTGRSWKPGRHNRRDSIEGSAAPPQIESTGDLISLLKREGRPSGTLLIQVHPERWTDSAFAYCLQYSLDACANGLKTVHRAVCRKGAP